MFQSLSPIIVAFLTGVAGPILIMLVKNYLDKKKKPADMVEKALEVSKLVTDKIDHIKDEFKADRVWIAQFHNGGHFYPT
jgi:capsular polysaccharide biosynthesis protein